MEVETPPPGSTFQALLIHRIAALFVMDASRGVSSVELTKRDEYVLLWIAEQYTVRFDTLQKLLGKLAGDTHEFPVKNRNTTGVLSERNTRRQIQRWVKLGLAEYEKFHRKQKGWVFVTPQGLDFLELPYSKRFRPTFRSLFNHYHVLSELRLSLEEQYGDRLTWVKSDRRLHYDYERLSQREKSQIHVVDGEITIDGQLIAIQVELSRKVDTELGNIIFKLKKQYSAVWYFVNDISLPGVEQAVVGSSQFGVYHIADYGILEADQVEEERDPDEETPPDVVSALEHTTLIYEGVADEPDTEADLNARLLSTDKVVIHTSA